MGATLIFSAGMMIPFVKVSVVFDHANQFLLRHGEQLSQKKSIPNHLFKIERAILMLVIQKKLNSFYAFLGYKFIAINQFDLLSVFIV